MKHLVFRALVNPSELNLGSKKSAKKTDLTGVSLEKNMKVEKLHHFWSVFSTLRKKSIAFSPLCACIL